MFRPESSVRRLTYALCLPRVDGLLYQSRQLKWYPLLSFPCIVSAEDPTDSTSFNTRLRSLPQSPLFPITFVKMQFFQITSIIVLAGAFVSAVPTPPKASANTDGTVKALGQATVRVYRSDTCTNQVDAVTLFQGGYRCLPYGNVRSVFADNRLVAHWRNPRHFAGRVLTRCSGCKIRAWSGNNCRGNSYTVRDGYNSVLFASVSIQC